MSIRAKKPKIYADNAAATPVDRRVLRIMNEAGRLEGNPSAFNDSGREAAALLEKSRARIAAFLGAKADEIVFTASGSEANSLAILGLAGRHGVKGKRAITSPTEHKSVLANFERLRGDGAEIKYVRTDGEGRIKSEDVIKEINSSTLLVSLMYANNEIGTINKISALGRAIREYRRRHRTALPYFHVDACQAAGFLDMNVDRLGADLLTFNGSKIYGPRGIAVLYVRRGTDISPLVLGGGQENGLRAGTENLPAIAGLAAAIDLINKKYAVKLSKLNDYFIKKIPEILTGVILNGPSGADRLPGNVNVSVEGLSSEYILLELDRLGVRAGSGSACTARSVEPSHVLKAIGVPPKYINGAVRFSLGRNASKKDVDYILSAFNAAVRKLKKRFSP